MSQPEVRKLPKKTIYLIIGLILVTILGFFLITLSKQIKMEEVLNSLGYKNIKDVRVYNVSPVEDEDTKQKGSLYKISFQNLDTNSECIGLIFKHNDKYKKDIECK